MSDGVEASPVPNSPVPDSPVLRVVNPDATPQEIAALVAVFAALDNGATPAPRRAPSQWASPERTVRQAFGHGLGAWRASGLPR